MIKCEFQTHLTKWENVSVIKVYAPHLDKANCGEGYFALLAKVKRSRRRKVARVIGVWCGLNVGSQVFTTVLTDLLSTRELSICSTW